MDASYILPFIASTKTVFSTMLQLQVSCDKPVPQAVIPTKGRDVSGIIGMSGDVLGSIVLSFSMEPAKQIVAKFVGADVPPDSEDFGDAVGELLNMICGGAKAKFEGKSVSISCPSVVVGEKHKVQQMSDALCITIPCRSDCGEFVVEVSIKEAMSSTATGPRAAASTSS